MLFVDPADGRGAFTMAGTSRALDVTFFSSGGSVVDRFRMAPCPDGTDATCPAYRSRAAYRYALEQPAGAGSAPAAGALGACAS
jgi:uncharacterized membrane protein (UPF0127 family)